MKETYMLTTSSAVKLYNEIKNYPIYDYHCHLSAKEITEDKTFDNIGQLWLGGDHYKWRLMRAAGIDEGLITGQANWHDKFTAYAKVISKAAGNPLYHWSQMELDKYFNIDTPLSEETAEQIWTQANAVIQNRQLSPGKLIKMSNVKYIATTDDVVDSLEYHEKLKDVSGFDTVVAPSMRFDKLLLINRPDYKEYIKSLSEQTNVKITNLDQLQLAVLDKFRYFCNHSCKFADIGIPFFPDTIDDEKAAARAFENALEGKPATRSDYSAFLRKMFLFIGKECKKNNIVLQLHLAVLRNTNTKLFNRLGADCGADCIGDVIEGGKITSLLDAMNSNNGLPFVILYTLNPSMTAQLAAISGCFPNVRLGAAWWFADHKRGIREVINTIAEIGYIDGFLGMLTDSRSFLSYARHDYFRRILADILAGWAQSLEFSGNTTEIAEDICYKNIKNLIFNIKER